MGTESLRRRRPTPFRRGRRGPARPADSADGGTGGTPGRAGCTAGVAVLGLARLAPPSSGDICEAARSGSHVAAPADGAGLPPPGPRCTWPTSRAQGRGHRERPCVGGRAQRGPDDHRQGTPAAGPHRLGARRLAGRPARPRRPPPARSGRRGDASGRSWGRPRQTSTASCPLATLLRSAPLGTP
jgi:hypothetical protein